MQVFVIRKRVLVENFLKWKITGLQLFSKMKHGKKRSKYVLCMLCKFFIKVVKIQQCCVDKFFALKKETELESIVCILCGE